MAAAQMHEACGILSDIAVQLRMMNVLKALELKKRYSVTPDEIDAMAGCFGAVSVAAAAADGDGCRPPYPCADCDSRIVNPQQRYDSHGLEIFACREDGSMKSRESFVNGCNKWTPCTNKDCVPCWL